MTTCFGSRSSRRFIRFWAGLLLLAPLAACGGDPNALSASDLPPPSSSYVLGSGDKIHVIVFGQPDLTGDYAIDGSGQIAMPLIGGVEAGGLTPTTLEQHIAEKLTPKYLQNPRVSVEVMAYRPFYIVGEVRNPGSYPFVSGMTVINAVALAGGFDYRARDDSFYLMRGKGDGRRKYVAYQDTPVAPGDVITVRERYF
jgi:protein involved in polysaccharide export with SLBB domain